MNKAPLTLADLWAAACLPNPVVLITTCSRDGQANVAVKSYWTNFGQAPDLYVLFVCDRSHRTALNILAQQEFVLNVPGAELLEQLMAVVPPVAEPAERFRASGLEQSPARTVRPPYIKQCRVHLECRLDWHRDHPGGLLLCGKVVDGAVDEALTEVPAAERLRLLNWVVDAGEGYATLGELRQYP